MTSDEKKAAAAARKEAAAAKKAAAERAKILDAIKADRETETGKSCVDFAVTLVESFGDGAAAEARQWVALGLAADKAAREGNIREAAKKIEAKRNRSARLNKLDSERASNVVPLTAKG